MTKKEFIKLIKNAKVDKNGNLYYIDDSIGIGNRVYFATVTTVCDDFVTAYCYEEDEKCERYDRHFTLNDDTLEIIIVKNRRKGRMKKLEGIVWYERLKNFYK